jgi:hypothetical protein
MTRRGLTDQEGKAVQMSVIDTYIGRERRSQMEDV